MRKPILLAVLLLVLLFPATAHAAPWSRTRLRAEVTEAARYYHLSAADTRWLRSAAVDIVHDGAHESGGGKHAHSGLHKGMWQYNRDWHLGKRLKARAVRLHHKHGACGWRCCRDCSTHRFVRGYAIVNRRHGTAAARRWVAQHWTTYGH